MGWEGRGQGAGGDRVRLDTHFWHDHRVLQGLGKGVGGSGGWGGGQRGRGCGSGAGRRWVRWGGRGQGGGYASAPTCVTTTESFRVWGGGGGGQGCRGDEAVGQDLNLDIDAYLDPDPDLYLHTHPDHHTQHHVFAFPCPELLCFLWLC